MLHVSEIGKFYTLALNFKGKPFAIIVTRHFRPKSDHLNEVVYCKPIDRTLPIIPDLWKLMVFGYKKQNKHKKTLKIISSKNKSFCDRQKVSKSAVPNTMAVDLR